MKKSKNFPAPTTEQAALETLVFEQSKRVEFCITENSVEFDDGPLAGVTKSIPFLLGNARRRRRGARGQQPPLRGVDHRRGRALHGRTRHRDASVRVAGKSRWLRQGLTGLLLSSSLLALPPAMAEEARGWRERLNWPPLMELDHVLVQTSLYTTHFRPKPEHNNNQQLIGVEFHNPELWFTGFARFKNSFYQASHYLYVGRELPMWEFGDTRIRAKLTAGALHGYRGEYRDKIPFNRYEIAPVILPALGVSRKRLEADLIFFGTAGMMVTTGLHF